MSLWQVPQFHSLVVNLLRSISSKGIPIVIHFILMFQHDDYGETLQEFNLRAQAGSERNIPCVLC